jgi:prolipoprotein diacylglyceryltransferase
VAFGSTSFRHVLLSQPFVVTPEGHENCSFVLARFLDHPVLLAEFIATVPLSTALYTYVKYEACLGVCLVAYSAFRLWFPA